MAAALSQQTLEEGPMGPLCLQKHSHPVGLSSDQSFCQPCVQSGDQFVTAPHCCPEKDLQLQDMAQGQRAVEISQGVVLCNHCTENPRPAAKTCLKCEASMCPEHLRPHTESAVFKNHLLVGPTADVSRWKCTEHQELLKVYCRDDQVCVCTLCTVIGKHRDHRCGSISEGEQELRIDLRDQLQSLQNNIDAIQEALRDLKGKESYTQSYIMEAKVKVNRNCSSLRKHIDNLEREVFQHLDKEQSRVIAEIDTRILNLEKLLKDYENSLADLNCVSNNEELVFIQEFNSMGARLKEVSQPISILPPPSGLDETQLVKLEAIIQKLDKIISELSMDRERLILLYGQKPTLNEDTAYPDLVCSPTSVSGSGQQFLCLDNPERFDCYEQVLCTEGLTSGRSYWEVKITEYATWWGIGVSYRSIVRKGQGKEGELGMNNQSWCLYSVEGELSALHKAKVTYLTTGHPTRVGVYVDFEAGTVSFYSVSDRKFTLLHTFLQQAFTEPLYPALGVGVETSLSLSF
uniref:tripartite motif-containing protein 14-like n=1 Tax=Pristiophorus japonicus TaxID=55135 RepID=UPI00398F1E45